MPGIARIPITNIYTEGDYTAQIFVGSQGRSMNVILDTGSSALALDGHKYNPDRANGDEFNSPRSNRFLWRWKQLDRCSYPHQAYCRYGSERYFSQQWKRGYCLHELG